MPNGIALARLPLAPEPPSVPVTAETCENNPAATKAEIAHQLGDALEALADISVLAWHEVRENGRLDPPTKMAGATLVARLYEIRSMIGEHEFTTMMHHAGRDRLGRSRHGVELSEAAVDDVTGLIIGIVQRVAITMRAGMS